MPRLLVILDGASEPVRDGVPTSLERAATPRLDALAATGMLTRVKTVADGLPAGSEAAIPALLGCVPTAPVDRGLVEAAAHRVPVPDGHHAWRIDVRCPTGDRAGAVAVARAANALRAGAPDHQVHPLGGHRLLLVGPSPLPDVARARGLKAWPEGADLPSGVLDERDIVVAARGACAGVARLLGATVVHPDGVTGDIDTDLRATAAMAHRALRSGARRVVVHVGGADEAAHRRDDDGKVAFLERVDRELLRTVSVTVQLLGGTLRVLPDHGCDPRTGAHDATPVPALDWTPHTPTARAVRRLTERAVAGLPLTDLTTTRTLVTAP